MANKYVKLFLAVSAAWLFAATGATASEGGQSMHDRIKARLDKLADRLEIKSSQQAAWEAFENSVEKLPEKRIGRPGEGADAAAIARFRADRAEAFAEKLSGIADATAKLESVLSPDQRKIFDEASRKSLERMRRHRMERGRE